MPFCEKCGAPMGDEAQFCRTCGAPTGTVEQPATEETPKEQAVAAPSPTQEDAPASPSTALTGSAYGEATQSERERLGKPPCQVRSFSGIGAKRIVKRVKADLGAFGYSDQAIAEYEADCMSGDWNHLIQVTLDWVADDNEPNTGTSARQSQTAATPTSPPTTCESATSNPRTGVAGFVCSLVGFLVPFVGLVGLFLSLVGWRQARQSSRTRGLSVAGIVIGVISTLFGVFVIVGLLTGGHGSSSSKSVGIATSTTAASVSANSTPSPTASPVLTRTAYMQRLSMARGQVLKAMAWVATSGASGKVNQAAFSSLANMAQDQLASWQDVKPPSGLKGLDHRWTATLGKLSNLSSPSSGDLRQVRAKVAGCLAVLKNTGGAAQTSVCERIASDLNRGLWIMSASQVFRDSCRSVAFKVLNKNAGSLKGRHVQISGQVFQIQDAGSGQYWQGYPDGIQPRTSMLVSVTDEGYGIWDDNVAVAFDGKLAHVFEKDIVRVWGVCVGQFSYTSVANYSMTVPLIHARYVTKQ